MKAGEGMHLWTKVLSHDLISISSSFASQLDQVNAIKLLFEDDKEMNTYSSSKSSSEHQFLWILRLNNIQGQQSGEMMDSNSGATALHLDKWGTAAGASPPPPDDH